MKTDSQTNIRHEECLAKDMVPGSYYCSEDVDQDVILPLDTKGNIIVFTKGIRYHDICMKTTCDKWGISRVRKMDICRLAWVRACNSNISYTLAAFPRDSELPDRNKVILNWEDALTTVASDYRVLHLSHMCLISLQYGCVHLDWMDYLNGGLVFELGRAGYLKEWYTPDESRYLLPSDF